MNYNDALDYNSSTKSLGIMLGLERVKKLLDGLDNPQDKLKIIHVAGTNGKGSVCSMTAKILQASGYKVGLFTSPVIFDYREQFRINGDMILEDEFSNIVGEIIPVVEAMEDQPTEFEIIVAIAFMFFLRNNCDIVVMEVGMGGLLDATNVFDKPLVSVIVNIDYDHMHFLGESLEEIANNKAGIIKKECPVVVADQCEEVLGVIKNRAKEKNAPIYITDNSRLEILEQDIDITKISYKNYKDVSIALVGEHQTRNAAVVFEIVERLCEFGFSISINSIKRGLLEVKWPGRFEIYSKKPLVILDGSHNPHGIAAMTENIEKYFSDRKFVFIVGILADKDYSQMIQKTIPFAKAFVACQPDNDRALDANECKVAILKAGFGGEIFCEKESEKAVSKAIELLGEDKTGICVYGSLYNIAGMKAAFDRLL